MSKLNTKANRLKQYNRGFKDANTFDAAFGQNNELGTEHKNLDDHYRRGWAAGRNEKVPGSRIVFRTDNRARELLFYSQLSAKEQKELDYVKEDTNSFLRYKGEVYDLGEFARIIRPEELDGPMQHPMCLRDYDAWFDNWDGYQSESHSSGKVIRYKRDSEGEIDPEYAVIGTYWEERGTTPW